MAKFLKFFVLLAIVTAMVWIGTLWRWHSSGIDPGASELLTYLVALPLVLTGVSALVIGQVQSLRAFASSPLDIVKPEPGEAAPAAPAALPPMLVLSTDVQSRAGESWESAQQGTASGDHLPKLHAHLVDGQGLPAFVADWPELDTQEVAADWEAFVSQKNRRAVRDKVENVFTESFQTLRSPSDDILRVLALLTRSLVAMEPQLREQWPVLAVDTLGAARGTAEPVRPPRVRIDIGLPGRWTELWHTAVSIWLNEQLRPAVREGLHAAGQSAAMAQTPQAVVQCTIHAVKDLAEFWSGLRERQQRWLERRVPGLMLVVMADSGLSQFHLNRMDSQRNLLTLKQPHGRLPGEGGAALLLATPTWVASTAFPETPPVACLEPMQVRQQEAASDKERGKGAAALVQLIDDLLQPSGTDPASVASLTTDADQRASRQAEMLAVVDDRLPHLDTSQHVLCVGVGCGDAGVAQLILCVAMGVDRVRDAEETTLVMSHSDPSQLFGLLLKPVPPAQAVPA